MRGSFKCFLFTGTTEASGNNRCTKTGMTSDHILHVFFISCSLLCPGQYGEVSKTTFKT